LKKLSELFQLDQPDLDFGFYRIMHAKAREVQDFIDNDLLKIAADAFGGVDDARKAKLQVAYEEAIQTARDYGSPNPEETDPVKKAKAVLDVAKNTAGVEADVYDHLYRFFERYYDDGDFISRRYYTRETSGKAAPFAIPYNGEEVKLYWANADQYYIKTSEYFSNFTFDLRQAREILAYREPNQTGNLFGADDASPLKVHFRVVEATEGEHGNIKASEAGKRFFILHTENPVALTKTGELAVNFEYRPDPEKTGQENTWREKRNAETVRTVLERLQAMAATNGEQAKPAAEYLRLFKTPAPTDSDRERPVLARYVNQYTARNTMDYFIHKDLGGFLRRELDFYIKNEVMHLDDIENADAPAVESYLAKIKVLRRIAGKFIDFLAQLENFQKKLWLKKKFIVETNYGITLDRVPEELYEEITANEAQREEWIKLFAIDEIQADLGGPKFSRPLTTEFLRANNKLVLDTRFFDETFKARLLASIENFDEQCDGLLIHSENFQALNLLQERYREQVKYIYIDPPYNTDSTPILYKNEYRHSSWAALMWDRLSISRILMKKNGVKSVAIDDTEMINLSKILENIYSGFKLSKVTVVHNPKGSITKDFNRVHEYSLFLTKEDDKTSIARTWEKNETLRKMRRWGENSLRIERRLSFYPIYVKDKKIVRIGEVPSNDFHPASRNVETESGENEIWPIDQDGIERRWNFGLDSIDENLERIAIQKIDNTIDLYLTHELTVPKTVWNGGEFDAGNYGNTLLINMLGSKMFDFPKSINLVKRCIYLVTTNEKYSIILDYFGGSGTTAHATIELNKEDNGKRTYILIEMGTHFENVLKHRTQKVMYAAEWKNGKPITRHTGISHCFKYIRLESYEDALNNLRFDHNPQREEAVAVDPALKEDFMLRYLLDVETRGSQSLLNIDAFADPTAYTLKVKKPGTDEYATCAVDLIETFNYLIGLRVLHTSVPQTFKAAFKRITDPKLPEDQRTKLAVHGRFRQAEGGPWWFRKVEGWAPRDPANPNDDLREKVLIIWRKLTADIEQDNLMLDEWFQKNRISTRDFEFDTIYVNGSNNLPNLKLDDENWKVRLIEEEFMKRMWSCEDA
jgi:adenine-specific DNA-methyltransferase